MRTLVFLFCTTLFALTPKNGLSQNDKIEIDQDKLVTVDEVFKIVRAQTDYVFVYPSDLFDDYPKVVLKKGVVRLKSLLDQSLSNELVDIVFTSNNTIVIKALDKESKRQQRLVVGVVTDEHGVPLVGVTVQLKGTAKGVVTDFDGKYRIAVQDTGSVLVFSSLGYETIEIAVGNQTSINIALKESVSQLDEVVVNAGYYKTSQKKATGSIGKVEAIVIEKQPVNNPLAAMQGYVPGVNILQTTGVPGGGFSVQIRGSNFIDIDKGGRAGLANAPLYIIDGVPFSSENMEADRIPVTSSVGVFGVSPLNTINPADIESIEVLKDADATAIYGSRGANGVILITTKRGQTGKTKLGVNISATLGRVSNFIELLNTPQYLAMRREALRNEGFTLEEAFENTVLRNSFPDLFVWDQNRETDWQEVLIGGTSFRQNAQVSLSGGNEQTQFLLSGSHLSETSVFPGDFKYKRTTARMNVSHSSLDSRFRMSASVSYTADSNNQPGTDLTTQAWSLPPNAPELFNADGSLNWENSTWENPLAILETTYDVETRNLVFDAQLSYLLAPSLMFKTSLGYTDYRLASLGAQPHTRGDPSFGADSSNSRLLTNQGNNASWIVEPQLNWDYRLWDGADMKLLLGATFQQNERQRLGQLGTGFSSNSLIFDLSSANQVLVQYDNDFDYKFQSLFGRLNINVRDKYILNLTGRRDGSSRFGPGKKFGLFGAVGTAWVFSEEALLKESGLISFGKLRASYGVTGSDNITDYAFLDTYEGSGLYNGAGLEPTRLFNPDYGWEETTKLETALELGLWKDRIFLTGAWYRNRSSNQLLDFSLPLTTGFSGINSNLDAIVDNTGIEFEVRTKNITGKHFKWSSNFNISANRNKLVAFPGLEGSTYENFLEIGESIQISKLYNFLGVDPETGIFQFQDYNGDGVLDVEDRQRIFDRTPKYFGGLGNTFSYKNLRLDIFFQFVKQQGRSYLRLLPVTPGSSDFNMPVSVLDRWQEPGDTNPIQRFSVSNVDAAQAWGNFGRSNGLLVDASFVRLRNVSLSYTVPKELTGAMDLDLYLQGQNLFVITPYQGPDPENLRQQLPPLRQLTLGLDLTF